MYGDVRSAILYCHWIREFSYLKHNTPPCQSVILNLVLYYLNALKLNIFFIVQNYNGTAHDQRNLFFIKS